MKRIILVDDDELVQLTWKITAKTKGIELIQYNCPTRLIEQMPQLDQSTPIYIDQNFTNDSIDGLSLAKTLYNAGFNSLHLVTGYESAEFEQTGIFQSIGGKKPPFLSEEF